MKKGGGKSKGSAFERKICKQLSLWWGNKDAFWRSPGSGSRGTVAGSQPHFGDVCSPSGIAEVFIKNIVIEMKKGYGSSWCPFDFIEGGPKTFKDFLEQVERDRKKSMRPHFWLIFQKPRKQVCLCADFCFWKRYYKKEIKGMAYTKIKTEKYNIVIVSFEEFLSKCKPDNIKNDF